ncbi:MAG TPA: phosphatase PAP2 family protein [Cytophagales bacterium]|nr:phosphatase PAP2 family protein [Cytophagales bacterium]
MTKINRVLQGLFIRNIFYVLCLLYFVAAGLFIYWLGKEETFLIFNRNYNPSVGQFYRYFTHIGDGFFVIFLVVVLLFVKYYYALMLLLCYAIPSLLVQFLKRIVFPDVARPLKYYTWEKPMKINLTEGVDTAIMNSFPSGHTASAFALFCFLAVVVKNPVWRVLFFILAVNCAISRVYISEHFFVDTYAGALISYVLCIIIIYLLETSALKVKLQSSILNKS